MSVLNKIRDLFVNSESDATHSPEASRSNHYGGGSYKTIFTDTFDGEKNLGEIGPAIDYYPDYDILRVRSWQAYLESEVAQTIFKKYIIWVLGPGLKTQAEPNIEVLQSEGIVLQQEDFNRIIESRFKVFCNSKQVDYAEMRNSHKLFKKAYLGSIVGGDMLIIHRYIKGKVSLQVIDGADVRTPTHIMGINADNGNKIKHGIEINAKGKHIAYWVQKDEMEYTRIAARSKNGLTMAYMIYGLESRIDHVRGMPLLSVVLESLKKLERYKEAAVGSAEERQKIAFAIEHNELSTGENPIANRGLAKMMNADAGADIPTDSNGVALRDHVAATTNKQVINMTPGSALKMLESKNELFFKEFYDTNADKICATVSIPPEVAFSKYDSNYSASRAAIKDWEHVLNVERLNDPSEMYQNLYNLFLDVEILSNKVNAPGYLEARQRGNFMALEAYRQARFVGPNVPHIDPLKEVKAEREKLGVKAADIPLTTVEAATEALNGGDYSQNITKFQKEIELAGVEEDGNEG